MFFRLQFLQRAFEGLEDPLKSPLCIKTYFGAVCAFDLSKCLDAGDPGGISVFTSLLYFFSQPFNEDYYEKLRRHLFRESYHCSTVDPAFNFFHRSGSGGLDIEVPGTGGSQELSLPLLIQLLARRLNFGISATQVPSRNEKLLRSWRRQLVKQAGKSATKIVTAFEYLLQHVDGVYVFALFGTLAELAAIEMVHAIEASTRVRDAFEYRYCLLVQAESRVSPTQTSPTIDHVFHGAGCVAGVMVQRMNPRSRFQSYFLSRSQKFYDITCQLLALTEKAHASVQSGERLDTVRLAHFGRNLYELFTNPGVISPLISKLISKPDTHPNGYSIFALYFMTKERCHNPYRHCRTPFGTKKAQFAFMINERPDRSTILQACSGCKAAYFCGRDCQKQAWKLHRDFCPVLKNLLVFHREQEKKAKPPIR